jgi:hypothetical protein
MRTENVRDETYNRFTQLANAPKTAEEMCSGHDRAGAVTENVTFHSDYQTACISF